jgi:hypothetical protein
MIRHGGSQTNSLLIKHQSAAESATAIVMREVSGVPLGVSDDANKQPTNPHFWRQATLLPVSQ